MSNYKNLMQVVEYIRDVNDGMIDTLEVIMFINENRSDYSKRITRELDKFLRKGAKLMLIAMKN